ncbi:MAG: type IV toxin-antitoxin system AbiEi family antitoxin domain-containing protein [Oscillospiraceae bacterium]|jgi:predicted transcriptional regulator of viral defense system|nr:type IV toxin-antitoxin system AbiEi family antitoxin domain-containing protein [Oscillospiraceae bacterium]
MGKSALQDMLRLQNGVFSAAQLRQAGGSVSSIQRAVQRGELERVARGVYQLPQIMDDDMFNAQLHRKQVIYSHDTALFLHGLNDRDPLKYSVTVPTGYNTKQLVGEGFRVFSLKKDLQEQDIVEVPTGHGHLVRTYSVERTVCDCLRSRNRLQSEIVLNGLKGYVRRSDRDLVKLSEIAKQFGVSKLLRTYLEVLL